jgi:hypothetical protein
MEMCVDEYSLPAQQFKSVRAGIVALLSASGVRAAPDDAVSSHSNCITKAFFNLSAAMDEAYGYKLEKAPKRVVKARADMRAMLGMRERNDEAEFCDEIARSWQARYREYGKQVAQRIADIKLKG